MHKTLLTILKEVEALEQQDAWSEYAGFPREDWLYEVRNQDTQLGYWDWVNNQVITYYDKACEA